MPITKNGYYNDPAMGEAFGSIADIFKPPSATDAYAAAKAAETKQKIQGLAELYKSANDPNITQEQRDRAAEVLGVYSPNQSLTAVKMGNDTDLAKNAADNTRALQETTLKDKGDTTRKMLDPVAEGATRFVPPDIASMYKVGSTQVGTVNAGQGDTVVTPDGRTIMGQAKPLNESEYKAAEAKRLHDKGDITDADLKARVMGDTPVETVKDAATGQPVIKYRSDAVGGVSAPESAKASTQASEIRKEIEALPSYKNYAQAAPIYKNMLETAGNNTRASDLNLIYSAGKIFDPNSVVREGEIGLAQATAALPDKLQAGLTSIIAGKSSMTPETRANLVKEANIRMRQYHELYSKDREFYKGIATRGGMAEKDTIPPIEDIGEYVAPGALPVVNTPEEAAKLPPGTRFKDANGTERTVPGG